MIIGMLVQAQTKFAFIPRRIEARPKWLRYLFTFQRDEGWKADRQKIADILEDSGHAKIAGRIKTCYGKVAVFKCSHPDETCQTYLRVPFTCKTVICPDCTKVAFYTRFREYERQFQNLKIRPGHHLYMITLTQKVRGQDLPDQRSLKDFFKYVRKFVNKFYPRKAGAGGLGVLEIGKGNNVHAHVLVCGPLYSRSEMSRAWYKITGDSYIVHRPKDEQLGWYKKNRLNGLRYVMKYIKKPPVFDSWHTAADYVVLMEKFRRIHTFGIFYNPYSKGGILTGQPKPDRRMTCPVCGHVFRFDTVDDSACWWDEKTLKGYLKGIDSS